MELMTKQGYKLTEVGLIPENWKFKSTIDVAKNKTGGIKIGPFGSALKKELLTKQGYKVYGQENVFDNDIEIGDRFINKQHFQKLKSCELIPGDFIVSMMGTIGQCMILPDNIQPGIMDSHLLRIKLDEKKVYPLYFEHIFSSVYTLNQIKKLSVGGIMDGLSSKIVKQIFYNLPPTLTEQKAIATALSDVDALIASLEQTITKKKAIKQGAMQQLLTPPHKGGKRLPGFSGEWVEKTLGEVYNITKGQLITDKTRVDGIIPVIAGGKSAAYHHNKANRVGKTITVSGSGANAGYVSFHSHPIFASDCSTIEESKSYSIEFIYFFLKLKQNDIYNAQTGGAQPHIHPSDLNPMVIDLPDKNEQKAIAQILSDMDAEITQLETKKEKYQAIKQGMMQELLTGKTRLI